MTTIFRSDCTEKLRRLRPSAMFLAVHHYINNWGEVSDFSICFHINYMNALKRSILLLKDYDPKANDCVGRPYSVDHLRSAKFELLESHEMSLTGSNPLATSAHAYEEVVGADGVTIPGVKLHTKQDILHLWGFCVHKVIMLPGNYGPDNRALKTMAKDDLRNMTPLGNFRQFKLTPGKFHKLTVQGFTIREEETVREQTNKIVKKGWLA